MVLLFICVVINYLDRSNISITAPAMRAELGFDTAQMGYVLSAFGWTYALCQIPGGWLVDRVAPRVLYATLIVLWSIATIMLGFTSTVTGLIAMRLLVGALESPSYPINNRVVTTWFPERERATAIGFYTSGQYVGARVPHPRARPDPDARRLAHGVRRDGQHRRACGGCAWYALYRQPHDFPGTNAAEIEQIRRGGGLVDLGRDPRRRAAASPAPTSLACSRRASCGGCTSASSPSPRRSGSSSPGSRRISFRRAG